MVRIFFIDSIFVWRQIGDLVYLRDSNSKVKFKQKLILVVSGLLFWICISYLCFRYDENIRLQEINNADIHKWEENRIK